MPTLRKVVTHPGGAHKDEFLACALLLAPQPAPVERREPEETDLEDPATAVVDIGGEHEPSRSNFDHHQFPADSEPTCALSLVLRHLGLYEDAREFCDWLETTEWFDCRGPAETAAHLGIGRETAAKLNSPIDITLIRRFAAQTAHHPGEPVWEVMRMIGADLLTHLTELRARLDFIAGQARIRNLQYGKSGAPFAILHLPRTAPLPEEPSLGLERYLRQEGLEERVHALIYPDRRGPGYALRATEAGRDLNFTRLQDEADITFAHARGFIAKTTSTDPARLDHLIRTALP